MAIDRHHFNLILESGAKGKCLSAGYPDLLVKWDDLPNNEQYKLSPRPDTEAVQAHHGWNHPIYDTGQVFEWMGLELVVIDREVRQGSEIIMDLNLGEEMVVADDEGDATDFTVRTTRPVRGPGWDLVLDPGTSEHCWNIAQAAQNLASAVKLGGHIAQAIPMAMFNHGYYNVNPIWFHDFYTQNGFEIKKLLIRFDDQVIDAPLQRCKGVPDGAVVLCLAKRVNIQPFVYPQQSI